MTKLQEIENKLLNINDAVFQNLCDAYLYFTERDYPEINRSGSQKGKQKTRKGTPDAYFQLPSGKYVLIEYTTKDKKQNKNDFFQKIKDDIDKCLNVEETHIKLDSVEKIIYCCNSSFSISEHDELKNYCYDKSVRLELKTLDAISLALLGRCAYVAKEFLGIQIDTAQILTPQKFVEEYEASGFATKLSNRFLSRDKELEDLQAAVDTNKVTIVNGAPGLGKTRLVLALYAKLQEAKEDINLYVISNKTAPIYDDLRTYIDNDKNYILLADDANRQVGNLSSILSLLNEKRKGKLHVVITVRDYAYSDILFQCEPYQPFTLTLQKLTDEQIKTILQSEDFNIQNHKYIDRILAIADGNPRLAVMAASVALQKQNLEALENVSDLYDRYFKNTIDSSVFSNQKLLKVLGTISFFQSINKADIDFCKAICKDFDIDHYFFLESLEKLERLELLESSQDLTICRVGEQILGTYFFYKTFFQEQLLDFSVILSEYFDKYLYRIKDTVIPANNTFGYENVYEKIDPCLTSFWNTIKSDEDKAFKFLDLFWVYKTDEALGFVYDKVQSMSFAENPEFIYKEIKSYKLESEKDRYLKLLFQFFFHPIDALESALELGAEYVNKKPETYSQYCDFLKDAFIFRHEDEQSGFYRQITVCDFLCSDSSVNTLTANLFYDVMPTLMKVSYNITSGGRKRNTISFYRYTMPALEPIRKFREQVWTFVINHHQQYKEKSENFIYEYLDRTPDKSKPILAFDLPFILKLIKKHFRKSSFEQCYLVQDFIYWFSRMGVKDSSFQNLKNHFKNRVYIIYIQLVHDLLKARFEHDLKYGFDEYHKLKETEIRQSFHFKTLSDFKRFYQTFTYLSNWGIKHGKDFRRSLDVVIDENTKHNPTLGIRVLKEIAVNGNDTKYIPWLPIQELLKSETLFRKLYDLIRDNIFEEKHHWLLNWFNIIPDEQITDADIKSFTELFRLVQGNFFIYLSSYEKFLKKDSRVFHTVLKIIEERNAEINTRITLDWHFFEHYTQHLSDDLPLLKRTYLQQQVISDSFDHDFKDFLELVRLDDNFLIEYLEFWSKDRMLNTRDYVGISIIWQLDNAEDILWKAFDLLTEKRMHYIKEDFCNAFFDRTENNKNRERCILFLKEYLQSNKTDIQKIDTVFDCVRHSFHDKLEEFILFLLKINPSYEIFKEISWTDNYFFGNGHTIWGDVRATQYEIILSILNKIKKQQYKYSKHKELIKAYILNAKKSSDYDRKMKFLYPD